MARWTACLVASAACLVASVALRAGEPQQPTASSPLVAPLLIAPRSIATASPVTTHGSKPAASARLARRQRVAADAATWEKVVRKLRGRMMPPAGLPRPDEATYDALAAHLESRSTAPPRRASESRTHRHVPASEPLEYQNAIRDLLALDVDVSALLPKDDASHGFDNVGDGELSPTLLERYLAAAQKVSRARRWKPAAVAGEPRRGAAVGSHTGRSPRRPCRSARAAARSSVHVPAPRPSTRSRCVCRATATRTSRG